MSVRYEREEEFLASAFKRVGGGLRDVQRATGTERLQTSETAVAAWDQSVFAKDLAEQLEGELGPLPGQIQEALGESAAALAEAGLARSDAAIAVSDAQAAVAEAEQAILDAAAASGAASIADGKAAAAQAIAQSAQDDADAAAIAAGAAASAAAAAGSDATDALADAETARLAAVAAQAKADQAFIDAANAATAAGNAQTSADGKSRVWYQGTAPSGAGHKVGDTWFDTSNGNRVTQWDGDSWEATQFGTGAIATAAITNALIADATIESAKIANLDAAKITTGTLDAARIAALSIGTEKLAAEAVTAAKIQALAITAVHLSAESVTALALAADAVTAETIAAGAVATDKLDALAVTAEKIAAGAIIAEKLAAGAVVAETIAAGALDAMTIRGVQIYGGYIESPVIASSDKLGSGANVLNDPDFSGTVNGSWVLSGHAGDAAVAQVDTITWDRSWTSMNLFPSVPIARRNWGSVAATLRLTPAVRKTGSLLFANYAWLNAAARTFTNPYPFPNQSTWDINPTGATQDPSFKEVDSRPAGAGVAKTSYLTNAKVQAVVSGERWNVRLGFTKLPQYRLAFIDSVSVEIINNANSAVLWSRPLLADELAGGLLNDWWDSTFTGSVRYRIKTVYRAAGGTITRRPAVGSYARWSKDGDEQGVWSATAASWLPYNAVPRESVSDSHSLFGTDGIDYIYRARDMELIASSAMLAKVEPVAGWRLSESAGFELFNSLGARTGKVDGENNFLAGTFATHEAGRRLQLQEEKLQWFTAAEVLRSEIEEDSEGLRIVSPGIFLDGPVEFQGDVPWTALTLQSGWANEAGDPAMFRVVRGFLSFAGRFNGTRGDGQIALLPVGARPSKNVTAQVDRQGPGQLARITVTTDGWILHQGTVVATNAHYINMGELLIQVR